LPEANGELSVAKADARSELTTADEPVPLRSLQGDFRVGDWTVLPRQNRIKSGDLSVHLRPRVMDVLAVLAAHGGEVVTRQEIIESVWRRRFIAESVLTRAVFELRRAFGDDPDQPRVIETLQGRGYRLLPEVRRLGASALAEPAPVPMALYWRGQELQLAEGETLIGRSDNATIRVASDVVSRRHARIVADQLQATLEDLGAKNGTYLNGKRLEGSAVLQHGDRITIGPTVLIFRQVDDGDTTVTELNGGRE